MLEAQKNEKFEQFLFSLADANLISIATGDRVIINDANKFLEFGLGLYLLWVYIHKRQRTPFLYFTAIDADHTLFLVSPYDDNPYFTSPKGYEKGKFYLDRIEKSYSKSPDNCLFCHLRNSILANISYFKDSDAFGSFLTQEVLGKLTSNFPKMKKGKCSACSESYLKWIRKKILQDERYGLMLGGYPSVLATPVKIFEILFEEPLGLSEIHAETGALFDSFLCVYLANKFQSKTFFVDSRLKDPFTSYEIDIGILVENDSKSFLVVETTSFYHYFNSLKNKFLNYSALRTGNYDNFLYIYLTLGQGISARLSGDRIEQIAENHNELGTFAPIFTNNEDLELLCLPPDYKDIDRNIKSDWWDKKYLAESYSYLINKLDDLTDHLAT